MPFVIGNGSAQIRFVHRLGTDPEDMVCTLGVRTPDPPSVGAIAAIYDAWADNVTPALSDAYTFRGFTMTGKTSAGAAYDVENYSNQQGGTVAEPLPQNCAVLVQKRTGIPGRKNRGRMYVPGLVGGSSVTPNGQIDATPLGALQTAFSQVLADLTDPTLAGMDDVVVLHPDGTYTAVSAFVVDDTIATQRRRLR